MLFLALFPIFIVIFPVCLGSVQLAEGPENAVVHVNGSVLFKCRVEQNAALKSHISWEECSSGENDTCRRIANDEELVYSALGGDANKEARFSIENPEPLEFNLLIRNTQPEDAGKYRCVASNSHDKYRSADLTIVEVGSDCRLLNSTDPMKIGDLLTATCNFMYHGRSQPEITWRIGSEEQHGEVIEDSGGNNISQTIIFPVEPKHDNLTLRMELSFRSRPEPGMARNKPTYGDIYESPLINVLIPSLVPVLVPLQAEAEPAEQIVIIQMGDCTVHSAAIALLSIFLLIVLILNVIVILYTRGSHFGGIVDRRLGQLTRVYRTSSEDESNKPETQNAKPQVVYNSLPTNDTQPIKTADENEQTEPIDENFAKVPENKSSSKSGKSITIVDDNPKTEPIYQIISEVGKPKFPSGNEQPGNRVDANEQTEQIYTNIASGVVKIRTPSKRQDSLNNNEKEKTEPMNQNRVVKARIPSQRRKPSNLVDGNDKNVLANNEIASARLPSPHQNPTNERTEPIYQNIERKNSEN